MKNETGDLEHKLEDAKGRFTDGLMKKETIIQEDKSLKPQVSKINVDRDAKGIVHEGLAKYEVEVDHYWATMYSHFKALWNGIIPFVLPFNRLAEWTDY